MPQEKQENKLKIWMKYFTRLQLPEKVGHVSVWTVDSAKSWEQSHECHPNHTHTADKLFYRQDSWEKKNTALETLFSSLCYTLDAFTT